ncbi:MAG: ISAzo13 family transposase, partial [Acidobacteria bacterium]
KALLDTGTYPKGVKVDDDEMNNIRLRRHKLHPKWNYTINNK